MGIRKWGISGALVAVTALGLLATTAEAGAVRSGFDSVDFPGNDDGSTGPVAIGFTIDFYGNSHSTLYVNNNGNATFSGPLGTFTPFAITGGSLEMLAPFFADVDTRTGNTTKYGAGTVDGRTAFGISWREVGYYFQSLDKLNTFQLVIIDRSDIAAGDFDFEFNYDQIQWETGDASGGSGGLGGTSAGAGWTNGAGTFYEFPGSRVNRYFLDSATTGLVHHSLNSPVDGRYLFQVRGGTVLPVVPLPPAAWMGLGLLGAVGAFRRLRRKS